MTKPRPKLRVSIILFSIVLTSGSLSGRVSLADVPPYAMSQFKLLFSPVPGSSITQWGTLNAIAEQAAKSHQKLVYVYLWVADQGDLAKSQPWRVPKDELRWLSYARANLGLETQAIISVVTVYPRSPQSKREEVYRAVVQMCAKDENEIRVPVYVDVANTAPATPGGLYDLIVAARPKGEMLRTPMLFSMDVQTDEIVAVRGNAPIRADSWVRLQRGESDDRGELVATKDPANTQGLWSANWLRRHMARAAELLDLGQGGSRAEDSISDVDFVNALLHTGRPPKATPILPGCDPDKPEKAKRLTRERAVAATVRFLYGSAAIANSPPPPNQSYEGDPYGGDWERAFSAIPGSTQVGPELRKTGVFGTALAKGLLYDEPVFRPNVPIRRDEAAWLISHALAAHGTQDTTGLLADAIDIPFPMDSPFAKGEIYFWEGAKPDEKPVLRRLYPALPGRDTLPTPPQSYPSVLCLRAQDLNQPDQQRWLEERIGKSPLVTRALDVPGPGRLPNGGLISASSVLISQEDAETIQQRNCENGMLDDWRVAFLTGVGARIRPPLDGVVPQEAAITVQFTAEMAGSTIVSPQNIWVESAADATPKPIPVAIEGAQLASSRVKEIRVRLPSGLSPGGNYRLVMGAGVLSAKGEPISSHTFLGNEPPLPVGTARTWEFQVDPIVRVYLRPVGLPAGAKLEAEIGGTWVEIQPSQPVSVPAGDLDLQARMAGGVFAQPSVKIGNETSYDIAVVLPRPDRIRALVPPSVAVADKGQIVLEALDGEGKPIAHHAPVELTLSATGGTVSPAWLIMTGRSTVEFTATTPGRAAVRISVADKQVRCEPEVGVLCRSKWSELPDWSDEERYHALAPEPGTRDICISPRLRRWFAQSDQDGAPKHRVKLSAAADGDRRELTEMTTPPLRYAFKRDSGGFLYVNRNAGDDLILAYEYHKGRCGVLVTGGPGEQAASKALRSELDGLLRRIGYECVTDAELVAALGTDYTPGEAPTDAQAVAAIAALSLDDVFVAHLTHAGRDVYDLSWAAWTKGQGAPWSTQGQQVSSRRIRVGTEPGSAVDPKELRAATQVLLDPWLKLVGLSFGRDMPRGER